MDTDFFVSHLETILVLVLFFIYLIIWKLKRSTQIKETGIDPEVIRETISPLQAYIYKIFLFLTIYAVILILGHTFKLGFFSVWEQTEQIYFDLAGFFLGIFGLSICFVAQKQMGSSWRVGIDTNNKTPLITDGLFGLIRNPTYSGLFMLFFGLWLIWSSWAVALYFIIFFVVIEVQVRNEEEYLHSTHGCEYESYIKRTNRYFPFIY